MVNDDHGDERMITLDDLRAAAEASAISVSDVVRNLEEAARMAETEETPVSSE
jgi:hypothetical protein